MSDLLLKQDGNRFDLSISNKDFELDEGLRSAVVISLFSDRRCTEAELDQGDTDRRGWWGDMFSEIPGDQIGSKLWLLKREKQNEETRKRAKEYAEEALQWMIEDGIAHSVTVEAEWIKQGMLGISVAIQQPRGKVAFSFKTNWNAELSRGS